MTDTRQFLALLGRLWKQNAEVRRILDAERIELRKPERKTHRFRDNAIYFHCGGLELAP